MSANSLMQMADIFLAPEINETLNSFWLIGFVLIVATIFISLLWRHYHLPLNKLSLSLRRGNISPRDAAHHLASITNKNSHFYHELEQLRFNRRSPDASQILALIKRAAINE